MTRAHLCALAIAVAPLLGAAAPAPKVHTVIIDKMKFGVPPVGARIGDTIMWINRDIFRHTATARDGSFNIDLPPGKSGRTLLRRAGSIVVYCVYHPGMTATFSVRH